MIPARPTGKFILAQVEFFQTGYGYYSDHGQTVLASWSKLQADHWRAKLPAREVPEAKREAGDGE